MSENETYTSQIRNEITTIDEQNLKIESAITRNCKQDIKYALLAERISVLEQEIIELRHILSGRQFMQRTLSYEDTSDSK
jgi:hypothetical protein